MKRAKKHRKRHILPGPAGLRNQRRTHSNNFNEEERNGVDANGSDDDDKPSNGRGRKRQRQQSPGGDHDDDPQMIHEHEQIWDAMCLSLDRILPSANNVPMPMSSSSNVSIASMLRKALSSEYTLLSDLSYLPILKIPRIVVQIRTLHSHGHCDYTVELTDESILFGQSHGHNRAGEHNSNHRPAIGWLSQSIIRNHPEWIRLGTVFLCHNISLAVFKGGNGHHDGNENGNVDRMLVLSEENIVYAWTKDNIGEVQNEQYLRLLEKRKDVEERYLAAQEVLDVDFDFDDIDYECEEVEGDDVHELNEQGGLQISLTQQHDDPVTQAIAKETNDDWSNIPTSSTMDNGTNNDTIVINHGRPGTNTTQLSNSQANINSNRPTSSREVERNNNSRRSSGNNSSNTQATISIGANQRLITSTAAPKEAGTSQIRATALNPSSAPAVTTTNSCAIATISLQNNAISSNTSSARVIENPYVRASASQQVIEAPVFTLPNQIVTASSQEVGISRRNPYMKISQAVKASSPTSQNRVSNPRSSAAGSTSIVNPYARRQSSTQISPDMSSVSASKTPEPSTEDRSSLYNSNGSRVGVQTSVAKESHNQARISNPYEKTLSQRDLSDDSFDENTPTSTKSLQSKSNISNASKRTMNSITPLTQHSSDNANNTLTNRWNTVQSDSMDMHAFDEEIEDTPLEIDRDKTQNNISIQNTCMNQSASSNTEIYPVSMTQNQFGTNISVDKSPGHVRLPVSLFSNLDNLEDNEMDAFLEDDD